MGQEYRPTCDLLFGIKIITSKQPLIFSPHWPCWSPVIGSPTCSLYTLGPIHTSFMANVCSVLLTFEKFSRQKVPIPSTWLVPKLSGICFFSGFSLIEGNLGSFIIHFIALGAVAYCAIVIDTTLAF